MRLTRNSRGVKVVSLLIDMLQGVVILAALAVAFAMTSGSIISNLVKMTNLKDKRFSWVLFAIFNLSVGLVFFVSP